VVIATAAGAPSPAIRRIITGPSLTGSFSSMSFAGRLYALLYDAKGAFVSPTATPSIGRIVGAGRVSDNVKVHLRGAKRFTSVSVAKAIPVGAEIDTTAGTASLTTAVGTTGVATGNVQSAAFSGGRFTVAQARHARLATVTLSGPELKACPRGRSASAAARRKRPSRRLFGSGKGSFTTKGKFGAATIRGTEWSVQDFCDRTVFKSVHGTVSVRDTVKRKTITLTTGHSYTVRG
jgi:hypothetical protein